MAKFQFDHCASLSRVGGILPDKATNIFDLVRWNRRRLAVERYNADRARTLQNAQS